MSADGAPIDPTVMCPRKREALRKIAPILRRMAARQEAEAAARAQHPTARPHDGAA